ncbi:MAG: TrkH family potassium uptake protein [Turicibacter sp.]|uniref:Ktr system potassium uptake protein D n=1 Tax=Turicibacter faecis TaxID=2963365 RepID=A0ABN6Z924_9FIRM|nr:MULTISPECIES: TrkH family potassium uptake protein [unclassified Turicibacter]MCI8701626.1 TrkH family potassium uptake protein [Turicibacter sp.]BEH90021.1 ktr system potassium uptake protein D [Turicibacter sp. TC023]MCU7205189.1 TrkH family potassium uptake protein [Turicibacter sp. TA25]MCU7209310.1 TrkH family potassium uptake protein [Turicibacter sp. 1E2]NCE77662.1 TrkH family potassium uptake protein [Turicibacter sp. TS3]
MFIFQKIRGLLHSTPTRLIAGYYFLFTVGFAILLWLPFSLQEGASLSFLDALFVSTSGLSNTGLSPISTVETFSLPGILILALNLQIGGLGLMMISTAIWLLAGHKISTRERALIMTDQNQINLSGVVKLVKSVLISFLVIELIFMLILGHYYYFAGYYPVYWIAMLQGFFTTVSAITNSGFDITGASLIPFQHDYFVQTLHMMLMFFGAMGFPVILDIQKYVHCKRTNQRFKFSIYTKLTMVTTLILWIVGIIGFYLFEYNHFLTDRGLIEGFYFATFNSLSTRNAGFATVDMNAFSPATLTMFCGLMFIGSSPNSSGGGIRTTTFAIMVLAILSFARGRQYVNIYGREIETQTVYKSFMIYIVATLIVCLSTLLICMSDSFSLMEIFFEVCSAFGTTGLSMGITGALTSFAKIVLIATMFIGRIGIITFLLIFRANAHPAKVRYPKADIIIG